MNALLTPPAKPTCTFVKANGVRCKRNVAAGQGRCWQHAHSLLNRWKSLTRNQTIAFFIALLSLVVGVPGLYFGYESWRHPSIKENEIRDAARNGTLEALDAVAPDHPHIGAQLTLSPLRNNALEFRIEVENIGKVTVQHLKCSFSTREMNSLEILPIERTLAPGGRASCPGIIAPFDNQRILFIDLVFESETKQARNRYASRLTFMVSQKELLSGTIVNPSGLLESAGDVADKRQQQEILSRLEGSEGTLFLAFPEKNLDGGPNVIYFRNSKRLLFVDCASRKAIFQTHFSSGQWKTLTADMPFPKDGAYISVSEWTETDIAKLMIFGTTSVDGR